MKKVLCLLVALLPITAFAGKPKVVVDKECVKMSEVANGLAKLKEVGYTVGELNSFVSEPTVQVFPIQALKRYVYESDIPTLEVGARLLNLCNSVGFYTMNKFFLQDEQLAKLNSENAGMKEYIAELERKVIELTPVDPPKSTKKK